MKLLAFSVFDQAVSAFQPPFFCAAIGQASRMFSDLVNDEKSQVSRHPEDYSLHQVGKWDDEQGRFEVQEMPTLVGRAVDYIPARQDARELMRKGALKEVQ